MAIPYQTYHFQQIVLWDTRTCAPVHKTASHSVRQIRRYRENIFASVGEDSLQVSQQGRGYHLVTQSPLSAAAACVGVTASPRIPPTHCSCRFVTQQVFVPFLLKTNQCPYSFTVVGAGNGCTNPSKHSNLPNGFGMCSLLIGDWTSCLWWCELCCLPVFYSQTNSCSRGFIEKKRYIFVTFQCLFLFILNNLFCMIVIY